MATRAYVYDPSLWYSELDDEEAKATKDAIRFAIESEDTSKFEEAARQLDGLAAKDTSSYYPNGFVNMHIPEVMNNGVLNIPYDHPFQDNAVAFMRFLRDLPGHEGPPVVNWSELFGKGFSYDLSDLNDGRVSSHDIDGLNLPDYPEDHFVGPDVWRNFYAYGARLTRSTLFDASYLFWHCMRDAFERHTLSDWFINIICDQLEIAGQQLFWFEPGIRRDSVDSKYKWEFWATRLAEENQKPDYYKYDERTKIRAADAAKWIRETLAAAEASEHVQTEGSM